VRTLEPLLQQNLHKTPATLTNAETFCRSHYQDTTARRIIQSERNATLWIEVSLDRGRLEAGPTHLAVDFSVLLSRFRPRIQRRL
jgi:hypothetical protein